MEPTDHDLLAAFRTKKCEQSFRQIVTRHAPMVFATARRITSDPHRAEEISQAVFLLLASKAGEISDRQPVAGWLYHTTRHRSLDLLRSEARRLNREQIAANMQTQENDSKPNELTGELEAALDALQPDERDVLVIRYLEDRQLREVGRELGISEQAAQKRVARALEKLRGIFGRRGVTLTSGALATMLAGEAAAVVPAGLISTATASAVGALAATTTATVATINTTSTMTTLFNLKTAAVALGVAAVTGTSTYLVKENEANQLRTEYQALNADHAKLADELADRQSLIHLRDDQIALLKKDIDDLPRLRGEIDSLGRQLAEFAKIDDEIDPLRQRLSEAQIENDKLRYGISQMTAEREFKNTRVVRASKLKQIGVMYRLFINAYPENKIPDPAKLFGYFSDNEEIMNNFDDLGFASGDFANYEMLYQGANPDSTDRETVIYLLREKPMQAPNGSWTSHYLRSDGAVDYWSKPTYDELSPARILKELGKSHESR